MTHDELLGRVNSLKAIEAIFMQDAIRAVVELHNPITYNTVEVCKECMKLRSLDTGPVIPYPCKTIQSIEKELE